MRPFVPACGRHVGTKPRGRVVALRGVALSPGAAAWRAGLASAPALRIVLMALVLLMSMMRSPAGRGIGRALRVFRGKAPLHLRENAREQRVDPVQPVARGAQLENGDG